MNDNQAARCGGEGVAEQSKRLTIGEMAKANEVSKKTLRIYQEKGILEPSEIDPETGYRFYDPKQSITLGAMLPLQVMGFSLDEINEMLGCGDVEQLQHRIEERSHAIDRQIAELRLQKSLADRMVNSCEVFLDPPLCGQIMLETIPERRALVFAVDPVPPNDVNNAAWARAAQSVRNELRRRNNPLALYYNVSGIVSKESLEDGSLVTREALVFIDESYNGQYGEERIIPGGQYLTLFLDGALLEDGSSPEYPGIRRMLEYAQRKGLEVAGDYIGETVVTAPIFFHEQGFDAYCKMQLPVKRAQRERR